jgi:hypothetical protein
MLMQQKLTAALSEKFYVLKRVNVFVKGTDIFKKQRLKPVKYFKFSQLTPNDMFQCCMCMCRMACRVLLATLSIPLPSAHPEFDRFIETDKSPLEKAQRLAILLGLSQPPTRASLLKDIVSLKT